MWYLVLYGIFAIWVFVDSLKRKARAIPWAIGTAILGPIVLPVYLATRPLKAGEVREGGTAWNILKNFAMFWTILMVLVAIWGMVAVSGRTSTLQSEAEKVGAAIGTALGLEMIVMLWFFPVVGAAALGFMLKKSSVVEKGPTGPLATASAQDEPPTGWRGDRSSDAASFSRFTKPARQSPVERDRSQVTHRREEYRPIGMGRNAPSVD